MRVTKGIATFMCVVLVLGLIPSAGISAKDKKPGLSKKKISVAVGKTVTVKVNNGKKAAKVTWKTSKKSVAKITKKTAKGNKARASVKGISAGKAKITAVYKLGNKKTMLKCTVTVKASNTEPTAAPPINGTETPAGGITVPTSGPVTPTEEPITPTKEPEITEGPTTSPNVTDAPKATSTPPSQTGDLNVNIASENVAFADTEKQEYHDGAVDLSLSAKDAGHGICYYLNDEHTSVDMSQYKSLVISYETSKSYEMAISLKNDIPAGAATSYWDGADSSKCPIVGSEQYTTFSTGSQTYKMDLSGIKDAGQGVFIKYNTYNKEDTSDPVADLTIKSITLIKDTSLVTQAPPTTDYTINLKKENLAYSNAKSVEFQDGKMVVDAVKNNQIGLYVNDNHSVVDFKGYKAIKIVAASDSGKNVDWKLSFIADPVSDNADAMGDGTLLNNYSIISDSGKEIIIRTDYMQPSVKNKNESSIASVLNIMITSRDEKYTISSITFLKDYPYEAENCNINITEENIAFSNAKQLAVKDGKLTATLAEGQVIGLYIKDDHSGVKLLDYYSFDWMPDVEKVCFLKVGFIKDVTTDNAGTLGGGTLIGQQNSVTIDKVHYWQTNALGSDIYNKIPENDQTASVVYFQNDSTSDATLVLEGLRLSKYKY